MSRLWHKWTAIHVPKVTSETSKFALWIWCEHLYRYCVMLCYVMLCLYRFISNETPDRQLKLSQLLECHTMEFTFLNIQHLSWHRQTRPCQFYMRKWNIIRRNSKYTHLECQISMLEPHIQEYCMSVITHWGRVTYMRQQTRSSLVQIMACRLFGPKPLSEPMLSHCQLDSKEQTSVNF